MALREKVAFNFSLGLIPDNITYSPCCSSYFIRWQFVERKMGKKRGTCPWKQFDGTRECHRTTGQLGDISASGQLVLALTHWVTPANKEYPYSPTPLLAEQFKDWTTCVSFLSQIHWFSNFKENQDPDFRTRCPKFLIQCVRCETWEFAFLQVTY